MTNFKNTTRRGFLAGTGAALAAPALLSATRAYASNPTLRIGHVAPRTGSLANFAEADDYIIGEIRKTLAGGIENNGKVWNIEIIEKDSQSNPNRAAEVASELILSDEVDFITATSTPDTVNPVADQAEINEVACITTDCPWQPYFFGRGGTPDEGFEYTYHFFWGLEDVIATFFDMWGSQPSVAKKVGGLFPNDADGNAWGDAKAGLPPALKDAGFSLVDPGRYQPVSNDFTNQIDAFKQAGCEIVTGNMISPDFATFWAQAGQQSFAPKVVTIGKALLFPSAVKGLGERADGLSCEIWWTPHHPFSSTLTNESAADLASGYSKGTGREWTQPIGYKHALFEVVSDVIGRCEDLEDIDARVAAIRGTNLKTIVGSVNFSDGPVKNVTKTPLVSGQWQRNGDKLSLEITSNGHAPEIPTTSSFQLLG
jgi:branched-chain amino acid transport system substrate-binding protein